MCPAHKAGQCSGTLGQALQAAFKLQNGNVSCCAKVYLLMHVLAKLTDDTLDALAQHLKKNSSTQSHTCTPWASVRIETCVPIDTMANLTILGESITINGRLLMERPSCAALETTVMWLYKTMAFPFRFHCHMISQSASQSRQLGSTGRSSEHPPSTSHWPPSQVSVVLIGKNFPFDHEPVTTTQPAYALSLADNVCPFSVNERATSALPLGEQNKLDGPNHIAMATVIRANLQLKHICLNSLGDTLGNALWGRDAVTIVNEASLFGQTFILFFWNNKLSEECMQSTLWPSYSLRLVRINKYKLQ